MLVKNSGVETRRYIMRQLLSNKELREIEKMFSFSAGTLRWHIAQLYKLEGVSNRVELMAKYIKLPREIDCVLYDAPEPRKEKPLRPKKLVKKPFPKNLVRKPQEIVLPLGKIMDKFLYFVPATVITLAFIIYDGYGPDSEAAAGALFFLYVAGGFLFLTDKEN